MLSHERIWSLIDALAARNGLSVSGLAKRAGLDPTTFNKSKRIANDGRLRWPSTESLAKILDATKMDVVDFYRIDQLEWKGSGSPRLVEEAFPLRRLERNGAADGFAESGEEDQAWFPAPPGTQVLMVDVGDDGKNPLYPPGSRLVVMANGSPQAGDRICWTRDDGSAATGEVRTVTADGALVVWTGTQEIRIVKDDVPFLGRILWASQ